jgi:hypothetical protein
MAESSPRSTIFAEDNGHDVMVVKVKGEFNWHSTRSVFRTCGAVDPDA